MKYFSPAKINLSLNIGAVRSDGYHDVDSVFHLIELGDVITIEFAEQLSLTTSVDLGIPQEENLAFKAAHAMADTFDVSTSFSIHIEKYIPHGGGMGGGSSNAATVIYALATMNGIDPHSPECLSVARRLGADVAVFLSETAAAVMTGRGDVIEKSLSPAAGVPVVIAIPKGASASTAEVYKEFDKDPRPRHEQVSLAQAIEKMDIDTLVAETYNNLGPAAIKICPQTGEVLALLRSMDTVRAAQVSGSGAACFAICTSNQAAQDTARVCREAGYDTFTTALAAHGVRTL